MTMQKEITTLDFRYDEKWRIRNEELMPAINLHSGTASLSGQGFIAIRGRDNLEEIEKIPIDEQNKCFRGDGTVGTLTTDCSSPKHNNRIAERKEDIRIRRLTPKECYRLMNFEDSDFENAEKVNSDSQLYKQAGNSIVVNCLVAIIGQMFEGHEDDYKKPIRW